MNEQPTKEPRRNITADAWAAACLGRLPDPMPVPASNYWSGRHAKVMRDAAMAGDVEAVRGYEITGTNTYAKALRDYRDALLAYLERPADEEVVALDGVAAVEAAAEPMMEAA